MITNNQSYLDLCNHIMSFNVRISFFFFFFSRKIYLFSKALPNCMYTAYREFILHIRSDRPEQIV